MPSTTSWSNPPAGHLRAADPRGSDRADDLAIDAMSADYVSAILDEVAPADLDAAEQAWRIQAWLRSARFTYWLGPRHTRGLRRHGSSGAARPAQPVPRDSTWLLRAVRHGDGHDGPAPRDSGSRRDRLPARHAQRPGVDGAVGRRARLAELYFPSIGCGCASNPPRAHTQGQAPGWTMDAAPTTGPSATTSAPSTSATAEASDSAAPAHHLRRAGAGRGDRRCRWMAARDLDPLDDDPAGRDQRPDHAPPGLDSAASRAPAHQADAERTEVLWQSLLDRLDDIEVRAGPGETPRQARDTLTRSAYLDGAWTESGARHRGRHPRTRPVCRARRRPARRHRRLRLVGPTARSRRRLTMRIRAWL